MTLMVGFTTRSAAASESTSFLGPMAQSSTHSAASSMAKLEDGGTILAMNSKSAGM